MSIETAKVRFAEAKTYISAVQTSNRLKVADKTKLASAQTAIASGVTELDVAPPPPEPPPPPLPPPPPTSNVVYIKAGDDTLLQKALDSAPDGTEIRVYPTKYNGIALNTARIGKVTVVADTANLPPVGSRVTEAALADFVKFSATLNDSSLVTNGGASGYTFLGAQFLPSANPGHEIVSLGSDSESNPLNVPTDLVFDRCAFVGLSTDTGTKRGIMANARRTVVLGSYFANFTYGSDANCFAAWNGPGPFTLDNCYLEASGEDVLIGGSTAMSVGMRPRNFTLSRSTLANKLAWKGDGTKTVKNALELKNLIGARIVGNIFQDSWTSGQAGYLVVFTPRNQGGEQTEARGQAQLADIVFEQNISRNGGAWLQLLGYDDEYPSLRTTNVRIVNNLAYGINGNQGAGVLMAITRGPLDVLVQHNTLLGTALGKALQLSDIRAENLQILDNVLSEGWYGIMGDGDTGPGLSSWDALTSNSRFTNNLLARTNSEGISYPAGNTRSLVNEQVVKADYTLQDKWLALPTTDGKPVGADIAAILAATGATL
jgi:hypothetical protein